MKPGPSGRATTTAPGWRLRSATARDVPAMFQLDKVCFAPGIAYSEEEIDYFRTLADGYAVVAEEAADTPGPLIGFAMVDLVRSRPLRHGHVITIDVSNAMRGCGVGASMMTELESQLKAAGAATMRLEVAVDNERAQRFYEHRGYVRTAKIPRYYLGKLDAWVMEKSLG